MRVPLLFTTVIAAALLATGLLTKPVGAERAAPVRVFAAASLTEVVQALARGFDGARVDTSFGGSSMLARQIRDGAPADVFMSASPDWIDFLREAGMLAGDPVVLARSRLVCIAPEGSLLASNGVDDPSSLLERIGPDGRIAIADEGVPAGEYARAALGKLGLLDDYRPHLVGQKDVRAVLHAVERGALDAGFTYATDAKIADVEVLFGFDPSTHPPIEHQAAVLQNASSPAAARRFLDHLQGDVARAILVDAGFALP